MISEGFNNSNWQVLFLTELGKKLKETREEKGMTLEDLQEITKIQKRYLLAIEQGRYEVIPGKFYVRAFIKQYVEAVGLDPEILFEEYRQDIPTVYEEDEVPETLSRRQTRKMMSKGSSKFLELLPKILTALIILGIIIAAWFVLQNFFANEKASNNNQNNNPNIGYEDNVPEEDNNKDENDSTDENKGTDDENPVVEEPVPLPELLFVENTSSIDSVYELKNAENFNVRVAVIEGGASWVNVVDASGKELFRGTLNANQPTTETFDLSGQESVWIRVGRAYETEIFVNDIKLEYEIDPKKNVVQNITVRFAKEEEVTETETNQ